MTNCTICGHPTSDNVDRMVNDGWIPDYDCGETHMDGPVCPDCCEEYLRLSQDGEGETKVRLRRRIAGIDHHLARLAKKRPHVGRVLVSVSSTAAANANSALQSVDATAVTSEQRRLRSVDRTEAWLASYFRSIHPRELSCNGRHYACGKLDCGTSTTRFSGPRNEP